MSMTFSCFMDYIVNFNTNCEINKQNSILATVCDIIKASFVYDEYS